MLYVRPSFSMASLQTTRYMRCSRRRPAEPVEHSLHGLGEDRIERPRVRRLPLEQAEGVLGQRQGVAAGRPGLVDELLQLRKRPIDPGQDLGGLQPEVDRPVPGLGRGHAHRPPARAGTRPEPTLASRSLRSPTASSSIQRVCSWGSRPGPK